MATFLLLLIYLAFISLGLPDSIIGVSWPAIQTDFDVPLEYGGYISLVVTVGTVLSSLLSGYIIKRLKTGKVIVLSIFLTSFALLGYSISNNYYMLLLFAVPLGFGAGSIDTALNNYVANNYKSHHMNWLHSFWGVGATLGPTIMAFFLLDNAWQRGFLTIAFIQVGLMLVISLSLPMWKKNDDLKDEIQEDTKPAKVWKIKGIWYALSIFLIYCAIEFSVGIWGSSYLVYEKGLLISHAAKIVTIYYLGITVGRFISGALTFVFSNRRLILSGIVVVAIGTVSILLAHSDIMYFISFGIVGFGLAPIFPSMIHDTPKNFGKENSQYVIGYQVAFAYIGSAVFPSLFGILYAYINISLFPLTIVILAALLLLMVVALMITISRKE